MLSNFNAQAYDTSKAWTGGGNPALPAGTYNLVLGAAEVKANANQTGNYLELPATVADGPQAGQPYAFRFNLEHTSAQTVEIAKKQLASVCMALGIAVLQHPQQLYGGRITVDLITKETQKRDGSGSWTNNECVGVWPLGQRPANVPAPVARTGGAAPAPNGATAQPSWPGTAMPAGAQAQAPAAAPGQGFAPAPTWGGTPAPAPSTPAAGAPPSWGNNGGQPAPAPQQQPQQAPWPQQQPQQAPAPAWGGPQPAGGPSGGAPMGGTAPWGNT